MALAPSAAPGCQPAARQLRRRAWHAPSVASASALPAPRHGRSGGHGGPQAITYQPPPGRGVGISTRRVHGVQQGADDDQDDPRAGDGGQQQDQDGEDEASSVEAMAALVVEELWQQAMGAASLLPGEASGAAPRHRPVPGIGHRAASAQEAQEGEEEPGADAEGEDGGSGAGRARRTLGVLLPCFEPALRARGANEAALRLTADLLAQPSSSLLRTRASIQRAEERVRVGVACLVQGRCPHAQRDAQQRALSKRSTQHQRFRSLRLRAGPGAAERAAVPQPRR